MEIFRVFGSVFLKDDQARKGLDNIDKKGQKTDGKFKSMAKTVGKWGAIAGAAATAVGAGMFALAHKVTDTGDRIHKASQRMGISTDALQEMEYWASQNGLSQQSLERAVGRLNQRMGMAANGNEKYGEALKRLGIDIDDVKNGTITTEDAFAQSIKTLSEMTNEHQKAELATEMFGTKMARDLLPALNDGSLSLEEATKKAQELGMVMDEDAVNASAKFQDTWDTVKRTMGGLVRDIAIGVLPMFQKMLEWVQNYLPVIKETFSTVFDVIGDVIQNLMRWIGFVIEVVRGWSSENEVSLLSIKDTIIQYLGIAKDFIEAALTNIQKFWDQNGERIMAIVDTVFSTIRNLITMVMEDIVPMIQEKLELIKQFWDENGEQIMAAVENVFTFIQAIIEMVMPIIQAVIEVTWNVIKQIIDSTIGVILGLVQFLSGALTGDFEQMNEGLLAIWTALWDLIKGILEGVWDLLSPVFAIIWQSISDWFTGLKEDAMDWGKGMIQGFIDGILGMVSNVKEAAGKVVRAAADFIGFNSPTKKGEGRNIVKWGQNMIDDGFLVGMEKAMPNLEKAMHNLVPNINAEIQASRQQPTSQTIDKGITQEIHIHSPEHMSPSETARKYKQASRELAMEWGI